jgi:hypothetical protein
LIASLPPFIFRASSAFVSFLYLPSFIFLPPSSFLQPPTTGSPRERVISNDKASPELTAAVAMPRSDSPSLARPAPAPKTAAELEFQKRQLEAQIEFEMGGGGGSAGEGAPSAGPTSESSSVETGGTATSEPVDVEMEVKIRDAIRWGRRAVGAILHEVEAEEVHHEVGLRATIDYVQVALRRLEAEVSASSIEQRAFQVSVLDTCFSKGVAATDVPPDLVEQINGVEMTATPSSELDLVDVAEVVERRFLLSVEYIAALAENLVRQQEEKDGAGTNDSAGARDFTDEDTVDDLPPPTSPPSMHTPVSESARDSNTSETAGPAAVLTAPPRSLLGEVDDAATIESPAENTQTSPEASGKNAFPLSQMSFILVHAPFFRVAMVFKRVSVIPKI